ncbi:MAG: hypothetical protein H8K10_11010 [Nitrospira sp.]|nr:hypothetical protein [Nitrospira sp.]
MGQSLSIGNSVSPNRILRGSARFAGDTFRRPSVPTLMLLQAVFGLMAMFPVAQAGDIPLSGPIPSFVYEIELTYIGERTTPTATLSGPPQTVPPLPYRPFVPILELSSELGEARPFGACQGQVTKRDQGIDVQWTAQGRVRCGQRIALHQAGLPMDLLSYQWVRLRGQADGQVVVALDDLAGHRREDNVPLATVTGPFDLTIPLKEVGRRMDLRYVTALVISTEAESTRILFDRIEVVREPLGSRQPGGIGFWVWNYRAALENPETMLATCRSQGCSRVLIQMPSQSDDEALWRGYARLLRAVRDRGIDALALDGYPEAIQEPLVLADKIRRLLDLVGPGVLFGVQLDIEPYLLPGFLEDDRQLRRYLETIEVLKGAIAGRTRLSIVIPFWLTGPTIDGRPLACAVMDRVDEVAVMSYRTDLDEVQDIAEDILRYGEVSGTPVWLAVETTALPLEQHVVLRRETRPGRADALLDYDHRLLRLTPTSEAQATSSRQERFRIHHRFTVRPERLTFAGRPRADVSMAVRRMLDSTSHRSFAGVIIHDLDGFRALAE